VEVNVSSHHKKPGSGSTADLRQKLHNKDQADEQTPDIEETDVIEKLPYDELYKKATESEQKASQHWDRLLRMQAETDNLQRRMERDVANAHKYALEKFVLELLPVIDNLERSLQTSVEEHSNNSVLEGIKMTLKMFQDALDKFGVVQINPKGEIFNPEQHQAISVEVNADLKPNTVVNVLQKGYLLNNRLIRPALVIVSKATP
jgi:molecular chaperone GrpE